MTNPPDDLKPDASRPEAPPAPTDPEDALAFLGGRKFVLTATALVFIGAAALTGKLPMADAGQWGAAILGSYFGVNWLAGRR